MLKPAEETIVDEPRVMMITGAASGIGRQLARDLQRRGHKLVATDIDVERLREAASQDFPNTERTLCERLDVREGETWTALIEQAIGRFGKLDVLLNVAGHLVPRWAHEMTLAEVGLTIDVNVKGVIFGTNAAARRMIQQGSGHIVNVASIAGLVAVPGLAVYSASKHAVRAFSLAASQELKSHGVYVTVVCPGPVATPMLDAQLAHEEAALTFSAPRALTAEEVSTAIIERALTNKPLEITVTVPGSGQGVMARIAGAFPEISSLARPIMTRIGKRNQRRMQTKD
jgi:3-oxoacyl-[acyl-carrier protein] reductase